jgi:hypothetical protein
MVAALSETNLKVYGVTQKALNIPNYTHEDVFCVVTGPEMDRSSIDGIQIKIERIHCFRINFGSEQAV